MLVRVMRSSSSSSPSTFHRLPTGAQPRLCPEGVTTTLQASIIVTWGSANWSPGNAHSTALGRQKGDPND